jgi:hypothetical protein
MLLQNALEARLLSHRYLLACLCFSMPNDEKPRTPAGCASKAAEKREARRATIVQSVDYSSFGGIERFARGERRMAAEEIAMAISLPSYSKPARDDVGTRENQRKL